ncbi:proepiregulin-like [Polymixia lowei]
MKNMKNMKPSSLLSLLGVMLVWPYVFTKSVSSKLQTVGSTSPSTGQERPQVERVKMQSCDSNFDTYCLNNGQCMLLVDMNEYHCRCDVGYSGPRCAHLELSCQPGKEEPLILTIVCVALLIIGLAGLLYFFYKWYKRNRCPRHQKRHGYKGVQTA